MKIKNLYILCLLLIHSCTFSSESKSKVEFTNYTCPNINLLQMICNPLSFFDIYESQKEFAYYTSDYYKKTLPEEFPIEEIYLDSLDVNMMKSKHFILESNFLTVSEDSSECLYGFMSLEVEFKLFNFKDKKYWIPYCAQTCTNANYDIVEINLKPTFAYGFNSKGEIEIEICSVNDIKGRKGGSKIEPQCVKIINQNGQLELIKDIRYYHLHGDWDLEDRSLSSIFLANDTIIKRYKCELI